MFSRTLRPAATDSAAAVARRRGRRPAPMAARGRSEVELPAVERDPAASSGIDARTAPGRPPPGRRRAGRRAPSSSPRVQREVDRARRRRCAGRRRRSRGVGPAPAGRAKTLAGRRGRRSGDQAPRASVSADRPGARPACRRAARPRGRRSRTPRRAGARRRSCRRRAPSASAAPRRAARPRRPAGSPSARRARGRRALTPSARAMATSDFSVRVRSLTRGVGIDVGGRPAPAPRAPPRSAARQSISPKRRADSPAPSAMFSATVIHSISPRSWWMKAMPRAVGAADRRAGRRSASCAGVGRCGRRPAS